MKLISTPLSGSSSTVTSSICSINVLSLLCVLTLLTCLRCLAAWQKNSSSELVDLSANPLLLFSRVAPVLPFINASVHVSAFYAYIRPYILLRSICQHRFPLAGRLLPLLVVFSQPAVMTGLLFPVLFPTSVWPSFLSVLAKLTSLHLREF